MHEMRRRSLFAIALLASASPLLAQEAPESGDAPPPVATEPASAEGARVYTAADFARFAPRTALDMLNQVPGFVIQQAEERRGLGQANTNILINGQRFSGKSNDVVTELGRISASSVQRIEIVDGATLNLPGLSGQVANIILAAEKKKFGGNFAWHPQQRLKRLPSRMTNGQITLSGSSGRFDYALSVVNDSFVNGNAGPEIVTAGDGRIIDVRDEVLEVLGEQPKISASLKHRGANGNVANLNAAWQIYNFDADEISLRSGPGLVDRDRRFHEQEREWNYELGSDYEFALGEGRLKLIGLRRFEKSPYAQNVVERYADGRPNTGSSFERVTNEGESILRGEYGWKTGRTDWQVAVEGALNSFDDESFTGTLQPEGGFTILPFSTTRIDERRAEALLTWGRPLSPKLSIQAAAGGEYSQLRQTEPVPLVRTFYRPKGFVSLAWKPSARLDVSGRIEREVGQLNFYDFAAFNNVGSGTANAGNPNLVPTQSWNGELEATRNLAAYGTVTAKLFGRLYEDVVDVIPIGATGQSPGNLDSASLYGGSITGTLNLDPLGIKGAKFDVNFELQKSRIEDQLTGLFRPINNNRYRLVEVNFRHDIPRTNWAYGGYHNEFEQAFAYRLDERARPFNDPGGAGLFVEHKNVMGLKIRGSVDNLLGTQETYTRIVHDGRRPNPVRFTEFRDRDYGPILTLSISGAI
jgi:hypothetical protein